MTAPYAGPRRWLTADEARQWACRGVWAFRGDWTGTSVMTFEESRDGEIVIEDGESWRFLSAHPDDLTDAPHGRTVERWAVVRAGRSADEPADVSVAETVAGARALASFGARPANIQRLILAVPEEPEILTVVGEVL